MFRRSREPERLQPERDRRTVVRRDERGARVGRAALRNDDPLLVRVLRADRLAGIHEESCTLRHPTGVQLHVERAAQRQSGRRAHRMLQLEVRERLHLQPKRRACHFLRAVVSDGGPAAGGGVVRLAGEERVRRSAARLEPERALRTRHAADCEERTDGASVRHCWRRRRVAVAFYDWKQRSHTTEYTRNVQYTQCNRALYVCLSVTASATTAVRVRVRVYTRT